MSALDKLKKVKQSRQGGSGTPTETPDSPSSGKPEIPENAKTGPAPWRDINCKACEGSGWSTKGEVCRICDATSRKRDCPKPIDFYIGKNKAGVPYYVPKNGQELAPAQEPDKKTNTTKKKLVKKVRKVATGIEAPKEEPKTSEKEPIVFVVRDREVSIRDDSVLIRLSEQLNGKLGLRVAEDFHTHNYYSCDPFKRREWMQNNAKNVVRFWREENPGKNIIISCYTGNTEEREICSAFFGLADILV